jgi:hypothetical protein
MTFIEWMVEDFKVMPDWSAGNVVVHNAQENGSEREPAMSMGM